MFVKGVASEEIVRITRETLRVRLNVEKPDNEDRYQGFALVDVRDSSEHEKAHIPGSTHIPRGEEGEFEKRYDREKEIIVYDASRDSDISSEVAGKLVERGFKRVYDYTGGLEEWKKAEHETTGAD